MEIEYEGVAYFLMHTGYENTLDSVSDIIEESQEKVVHSSNMEYSFYIGKNFVKWDIKIIGVSLKFVVINSKFVNETNSEILNKEIDRVLDYTFLTKTTMRPNELKEFLDYWSPKPIAILIDVDKKLDSDALKEISYRISSAFQASEQTMESHGRHFSNLPLGIDFNSNALLDYNYKVKLEDEGIFTTLEESILT